MRRVAIPAQNPTLKGKTMETIVKTLDEALAVVASRSFYEDTLITPLVKVGESEPYAYAVEDGDHILSTDEVTWTYAGGICDGPESEKSRLMESYETFTEARHIRYHMSESVEALEDGSSAVVFAYATVTDEDASAEDDDNLAGWALLALTI